MFGISGYAVLPFTVLPALLMIFCSVRTLAHIFTGYVRMIKLRRIPKTPYDMLMLSKDSFTVCIKSCVFTALSCAVESVVFCIAYPS